MRTYVLCVRSGRACRRWGIDLRTTLRSINKSRQNGRSAHAQDKSCLVACMATLTTMTTLTTSHERGGRGRTAMSHSFVNRCVFVVLSRAVRTYRLPVWVFWNLVARISCEHSRCFRTAIAFRGDHPSQLIPLGSRPVARTLRCCVTA